jgi:hypothetical protein
MAAPELIKMIITGYEDEKFSTPISGKPYKVMINPDSIKHQGSIDYNDVQPPDSSTTSQRYKSTPSEKLNFDIVIDCTGVVDKSRTKMKDEINALTKIIYDYNGEIHRPNFVMVQWGQSLLFKGVLASYDISYTLFNPDGNPLRAKVSLAFTQYISPAAACECNKDSSPDISHLVTVTEGVSLPSLCEKVWNDESYYVQVARYNGLNKFRNLSGVRQLIFPPIIQPT